MKLITYDEQFEFLLKINNGYVRKHFLTDTTKPDYNYIKIIATEKAKQDFKVDIMPTLNAANDPLRTIIFSDAFENKNPDLRINGELWEVEQPNNPQHQNNLGHSISNGAKQAAYVIINLIVDLDYAYIKRTVNGKFKQHKKLQIVEFRYEGVYIPFKRKMDKL